MAQFCRLFALHSPQILANKAERWKRFIRATRTGTLLDRPKHIPRWRPYKVYEVPIWDCLQGSYAHVRLELETIRNILAGRIPGLKIIFLAGDGLALMRVNSLLQMQSHLYLDTSPVIIPIQGEHPHGQHHAMHCMLRLYKAFVVRLTTQIGCEKQIGTEPDVSDFNVHRFFFLNVATRACAEYLDELGNTEGADDLDDPIPVLAKASNNVDFEWLVHFLYDAGFFLLDFMQQVRGNGSRRMDVLWREFFASAHTDTAHKTQYVGMAIMRVFWGTCLSAELDALYHEIRTAPTNSKHPGSNVGWDMLIEWLNKAIKAHVTTHITKDQISQFLRNWPFMETVHSAVRDFVYRLRAARDYRWRDVDGDVEKLKDFFREKIGRTWTYATRQNAVPHVLAPGESRSRPWKEIERKMGLPGSKAPHVYVQDVVNRYTGFFQWQP